MSSELANSIFLLALEMLTACGRLSMKYLGSVVVHFFGDEQLQSTNSVMIQVDISLYHFTFPP